ncbi:MAG TPA: HD domain-containing protein [Pyrinomonadaceae bacterium]|nr:HD domain-containing protein [Pyrinomonadaceae bacterium]
MAEDRNYRDAVHNIIRVDIGTAEGQLIARLIDTTEFQRLRRVRQLGLAYFAYQTAEHSRFTHSLGAFHLATRVLDRLASKYEISNEDRIAVRVAALLHDVGHGPFSHVIESILDFHHEDFTIEAVLSDETGIGKALREFSDELPNDVAAIIRGDFRRMALGQLVSSQLDVDRMDYLLRDSLMTGVKYGVFDLEWVLKSIEINEDTDQLYVSAGGIYAVEDYLQARYYMFRQVYFHRSLRAAEVMLHSLFRRALGLYKDGKIWFAQNTAFESILAGQRLSLHQHLSLDDMDFVYHVKRWQESDDPILSDLAIRFLDRRLFKAIDLDMPEDEKVGFVQQSRSAVASAGFDASYYFVEDTAGDEPHFFYSSSIAKPKDLIFVEEGFSRPNIKEISEISAAVRGLQKGFRAHRICFPAEVRGQIDRLYRG